MQPTFGWRLPSFYRFQVLLTVGIFAVVSIPLATRTFPAPPWFVLGWIATFCWNCYARRRDGPCGDHQAGTILAPFATPGFAEFAAALRVVQATVSVRVGRLAQLSYPRRWLAGAGFYRDD